MHGQVGRACAGLVWQEEGDPTAQPLSPLSRVTSHRCGQKVCLGECLLGQGRKDVVFVVEEW